MATRTPRAGGFFIVVGIAGGLAWGLFAGRPLDGALIGTLAGSAVAVTVWLVDRRR